MLKSNKALHEMTDHERLVYEIERVKALGSDDKSIIVGNSSSATSALIINAGSDHLWNLLKAAYEELSKDDIRTEASQNALRLLADAGEALQLHSSQTQTALAVAKALEVATLALVEERDAAYERGQEEGHEEGFDAGMMHYAECETCAENADIELLTERILTDGQDNQVPFDMVAQDIIDTYKDKVLRALAEAQEVYSWEAGDDTDLVPGEDGE